MPYALTVMSVTREQVPWNHWSREQYANGELTYPLAADVSGQRSVGLIVPDWPLFVAEGETTRYVGDVLACVAASSRAIARAAAMLIEVDYEVLEPVTDMHAALADDAPSVHEMGNRLSMCEIRTGDVDTALEECAFTTARTYETQRIEHGYMEPEACLARPDGRRVLDHAGECEGGLVEGPAIEGVEIDGG